MNKPQPEPVELLSTQIAQDMVASCNQTCGSGSPSLDELLNRETLTKIIDNIKSGKGLVKVKGVLRFTPNGLIIKAFNNRMKTINPIYSNLMCVTQCNISGLSNIIKAMIEDLGFTEPVNENFEATNATSGGRVRRTRKQKQAARTRRRRHHYRHSRRN